jgi:hypothetical protein
MSNFVIHVLHGKADPVTRKMDLHPEYLHSDGTWQRELSGALYWTTAQDAWNAVLAIRFCGGRDVVFVVRLPDDGVGGKPIPVDPDNHPMDILAVLHGGTLSISGATIHYVDRALLARKAVGQ